MTDFFKQNAFKHGLFHTWDRWCDTAEETQRRECLKCGKSQVRNVATCRHAWVTITSDKVFNCFPDGSKNYTHNKHVYRCMKCGKVKSVTIPYAKNEKMIVEIL
jgi:hypothetical protein